MQGCYSPRIFDGSYNSSIFKLLILKVVQDDFHLHTLDSFLNATAQLQRNVNIKQIVISLIDRFANYAARVRDEDSISEGIL